MGIKLTQSSVEYIIDDVIVYRWLHRLSCWIGSWIDCPKNQAYSVNFDELCTITEPRTHTEGKLQVSTLNDLLACDKAVPAEPLSWSSQEELTDLYLIYTKSIPKPEKLSRLQYLLDISDSTAAILRDTVERGSPLPLENEEEFAFWYKTRIPEANKRTNKFIFLQI